MEFINDLFNIAQNNFAIMFFIGMFATFSETFFSPLPLLGIVITNALILGFIPGLMASLCGSILGTIVLFILCKKFSNTKLMNKLKSHKVLKMMNWVKEQGVIPMMICYSCPFVPGFLVSIASGISDKSFKSFAKGMVLGRIILFTITSYIGSDILGFIRNPIKVIIIVLLFIGSFVIGKKLAGKMDEGQEILVANELKLCK